MMDKGFARAANSAVKAPLPQPTSSQERSRGGLSQARNSSGNFFVTRTKKNPARPSHLPPKESINAGTWRMTDRVKWWDDYAAETPVLYGHYWRWMDPGARGSYSKGEPDLFTGAAPNAWVGRRRNAFCTDFSVGARYKERELGASAPWRTRLAAVRWPERELLDDHGERRPLV